MPERSFLKSFHTPEMKTVSQLDPVSDPATANRGVTVMNGQIGDWLLCFSDDLNIPDVPARMPGMVWKLECSGDFWQLARLAPDRHWRGSPLTTIRSPEWTAWLAGELYGTAQPDETVMALLGGRARADALNGHFLLLALNRPAGEWHLWTSRHGTFHAYLAGNGRRVALGTFFPAVAAASGSHELDWLGLASFFGFGFFASDRTHFSGVRTLQPACHYRFDARGCLMEHERSWHWRHAPNRTRTYDETLEEFGDLFGRVMGELTAAGQVALPISGGLDSRSTVAALPGETASSSRLWAYSYGFGDDSMETEIARQVARCRGLRFDSFAIGPYLFSSLDRIMAAVEGFEDVTICRQAAVTDEIDQRSDFLIAAHWGDVFLDDMGLDRASHPAEDLRSFAARKFRKRGSDWLLDHLVRPWLGVDPAGALQDLFVTSWERTQQIDDIDFRFKALKTEHWSARWTTVGLRMFQAAAFPRLPFYDTRMSDFFCTVPTGYLRGRRLQIDYLKRYAPDLAGIRWQATGRDLFQNGQHPLMDMAARALRKGQRRLGGRKIWERNWEVQLLSEEGFSELSRRLLSPGLALHEFLAPAPIAELLASFRADPWGEHRGYAVAMLLTFSAWLELQAYRVERPL